MPYLEFRGKELDADRYPDLLASLNEKGRLVDLAKRSMDGDVQRLDKAFEAGLFDAKPFFEANLKNQRNSWTFQSAWLDRCEAALACMASTMNGPDLELSDGSVGKPSFQPKEESRAFLEKFCNHIAKECALWSQLPDDKYTKIPTWTFSVSQAMNLACMMDRPDLLQTLIDAKPSGTQTFTNDEMMGRVFSGSLDGKETGMEVLPLFTAMQFSSVACTRLLLKHASSAMELAQILPEEDDIESIDFEKSFKSLFHHGNTETLTLVASHFLKNMSNEPESDSDPDSSEGYDDEDEQEVSKTAEERLKFVLDVVFKKNNDKPGQNNAQTLAALLQAGWADPDPVHALSRAISHARPEVFQRFDDNALQKTLEDMPLESVTQSPFYVALKDKKTEGLMALSTRVLEAGEGACSAFLKHWVQNTPEQGLGDGKPTLNPLMADELLNTQSGVKVLPFLLEMGLDPETRLHATNVTVTGYAKASTETNSFSVIKSFLARKMAHQLIDDLSPTPVPAP